MIEWPEVPRNALHPACKYTDTMHGLLSHSVWRGEHCPAMWQAQYLRHNAAVRAMVPEERLLVVKVRGGWLVWLSR